jgi:hypothetical protein
LVEKLPQLNVVKIKKKYIFEVINFLFFLSFAEFDSCRVGEKLKLGWFILGEYTPKINQHKIIPHQMQV